MSDEITVEIHRRLPGAEVEETAFESGALDVRVVYCGKICVLQRTAAGEIGVSLLSESNGFTGHEHVFDSAKAAIDKLERLLADRVC